MNKKRIFQTGALVLAGEILTYVLSSLVMWRYDITSYEAQGMSTDFNLIIAELGWVMTVQLGPVLMTVLTITAIVTVIVWELTNKGE